MTLDDILALPAPCPDCQGPLEWTHHDTATPPFWSGRCGYPLCGRFDTAPAPRTIADAIGPEVVGLLRALIIGRTP
jgi:hypothetical protein